MNLKPNRFTIRVYGLLIDNEALLLSTENIKGKVYTKLPGGGLEFGEGTLDCLRREFQEEAQIQVEPQEHFYTTEHFVASAFDARTQVMSIYYRVTSAESHQIKTGDFSQRQSLKKPSDQLLHWKKLAQLTSQDVDLPIDKVVIEKLLQQL